MPVSKRVAVGFTLSVVFHLIVFLALALIPEPAPNPVAPDEKKDQLEVTFQAPPEEPEKTEKELIEKIKTAKEIVPIMPMARHSIKTQLDPANLKKVDKAPEHAEFLAAHNSAGNERAKGAPSLRKGRPPSEDGMQMPARTAQQSPEPAESAPTPDPQFPRTTPLPRRRTARISPGIPKPTPIPRLRLRPSPTAAAVATFGTPVPTRPKLRAGGGDQGENGKDNENAVAAIGSWRKAIINAVGACWTFYQQSRSDLPAGEVLVKFAVDVNGNVSDVRVISNTSNDASAVCAVRSVREAEIPPMPPDQRANYTGRLHISFTATIFRLQ